MANSAASTCPTPSMDGHQQDLTTDFPASIAAIINNSNTIPPPQLCTVPFWNIDGLLLTCIAHGRLKEWESTHLWPTTNALENPLRAQIANLLKIANSPDKDNMQIAPSLATYAGKHALLCLHTQTAQALAIFCQSTQWKYYCHPLHLTHLEIVRCSTR